MLGRRGKALLLAFGAAGVTAALVATRPAAAFPPGTCHGTSCTGSTTASFAGVPVCEAGTATYWEDSYIPADVKDPRLAKFTVTPDPPCTGATVGAPTSDPWPASNTDPDGQPAGKKEAGKAIFRFRWTVTVPPGSKAIGTMNVAWTLDWTAPTSGGSTTTSSGGCPHTGVRPAACRFDLEVQITAPDFISGDVVGQRIAVKVNVFNNGPASSPPFSISAGQFFLIPGLYHADASGDWSSGTIGQIPVSATPGNCEHLHCPVPALAPHGATSFMFALLWVSSDRAFLQKRKAEGLNATIVLRAGVNGHECVREEVTCKNNETEELIRLR